MNNIISIVVGVLVSILLETVPGLNEWWSKKKRKNQILLAFSILVPVAMWLLACFVNITLPFDVACTNQGLFDIIIAGVTVYTSTQGTYNLGVNKLPNARARNI